MKRIFLFFVVVAVVSMAAEAKLPRKNNTSLFGDKVIESKQRIVGLNTIQSVNKDLVKVRHSQRMQPIRSGNNDLFNSSTINKPNSTQFNLGYASVPDKLIGTFNCKGISYFGGVISGETVITADNSDANKIWISNFIPGASNKAVYGIVSADQKTISIPQGQQIYLEGSDKATLSIHQSTDDVIGLYDASTGVITITTDLWGAEASDGWFELFSGSVTYTRIDMLPPVASYRQPQGGLFVGLDPDTWLSHYSSCIINSPYVTWNWKSTNIEENVSYLWSCTDSVSGEIFTSDQDSLLMDVGENFYNTPILKATNKEGYSSTFVLGSDYQNKEYQSYTIAGGDAVWLGYDKKCDYGVANMDNGFTLLSYSNNSYFFGTGASQFSDEDYESLLVYYEEPLSTLYFEGVNVYLFVFDAPENTPFTMNVVLAEKNEEGFSTKGEVIASSTILAKDVVTIKNSEGIVGYTMKFTEFVTKDSEGFDIILESIETDKAFFLELSGFNVDGVSLAVCTEELNPSDGESRSNFMLKGDESVYFWGGNRQTMYFNLAGAAYSYISLDQNSIYDNRSGGIYNIEASPFFDTLYFDNESIPDWLNVEIVDEEYSDAAWGATVRVTVDPLGVNEGARYYNITLKTVGATKTLWVNQGGAVSTENIKNEQFSFACKSGQGFMIKYPREMSSMTVYNESGINVGMFNLPETGSYQLDCSAFSKGLYILKLQGTKGSETIKVVKD